jgi:hypothetical protein
MTPIIVFYHCLFQIGAKVLPAAPSIVYKQMTALKDSGLLDACDEFRVGVNGGDESKHFVEALIPRKAIVTYHGLQCRNELRTLLMIEDWCRNFKPEAYILNFHSKGATHAIGSDYEKNMSTPWRARMMKHCVEDWRLCVKDLREGYESCGAHWLTGQGWDKSQFYFAGTCYWVRASFLRTLPSVMTRQRIKDSGIDSIDSRFEAEVILSIGPRLPKVKNYYAGGIGT